MLAFSNLTYETFFFFLVTTILITSSKNTASENQLKLVSHSWEQTGENHNYNSLLTGKQKLEAEQVRLGTSIKAE